MGKPSRLAGKGAILAVAASLAIGVFSLNMTIGTPLAHAATGTPIVQNSFESPYEPWGPRGIPAAALTVTNTDGHDSSSSLMVTGRTGTWNGPSITRQILIPGETYSISAWVKLAPDAADSSNLKFTVQRNDSTGATKYDPVNDPMPVTKDAWVQIGGSYTYPTGSSVSEIYIEASDLSSFLVDDVSITYPAGSLTLVQNGFETPYEPWGPRGIPAAALTVTNTDGHDSSSSLMVTGRTGTWNGPSITRQILIPGQQYTLSAWVKLAPDAADSSSLKFTVQRNDSTGATKYDPVNDPLPVTKDAWVQIGGDYTFPTGSSASEIYIEASDLSSFLVDDVLITANSIVAPQLDLKAIKDTVDFPVGAAVAATQTTAPQSDLLVHHFDQVTPNNSMKPESWYDADHNFSLNSDAKAIMDFAAANDLRVYGHTLVWHSQTPDWFFQHDDGTPLTSSAADQAILKQRLQTHINNVAKTLSDQYGLFGSDTNPLVAFDVVNEAIDTTTADNLRHSPWYSILGPDYIALAFQYANEAFNTTYAAPGVTHPITLFINDYGTEGSVDKEAALHAEVASLIKAGVPVDGIGHQFHVTMATPVSALKADLDAFADLPVVQAVTEFDVDLGATPTANDLAKEGVYYMNAFNDFRAYNSAHQNDTHGLFSVTMWGLADNLDSGWLVGHAPLPFDSNLQAKDAYYGIVNDKDDMTPVIESANVYADDITINHDSLTDLAWKQLPLIQLDENTGFQFRWDPSHLTVYVTVADSTPSTDDAVTIQLGDATYTINRSDQADNSIDPVLSNDPTGYTFVKQLPLTNAKEGDQLAFDIQVAGTPDGPLEWNYGDAKGTLTLLGSLDFVLIPQTTSDLKIDGVGDDAAWTNAAVIFTDKPDPRYAQDGATATVKLLWKDQTLYVLMDVADPTISTVSTNEAYLQDSVEIYVDRGNIKDGTLTAGQSTQMRIGADGLLSFGSSGGSDLLIKSGAVEHPGVGYTIEAAIDLSGTGGDNKFEGLDFQVNDITDGARTSAHNWAETDGNGYRSDALWGVGMLLPLEKTTTPPEVTAPTGGTSQSTSTGTAILFGTLLLAVGGAVLNRRFHTI